MTACTAATTTPPAPIVETISFSVGVSGLSGAQEAMIESFLQRWHDARRDPSGAGGRVRQLRWRAERQLDPVVLSRGHRRRRAQGAAIGWPKGAPGDAGGFANGETDQFSDSDLAANRVVTIEDRNRARASRLRRAEDRVVGYPHLRHHGGQLHGSGPPEPGCESGRWLLGNGIEHQALIADHDPAYSYDVKRTRSRVSRTVLWFGVWSNIGSRPAAPDDTHNRDECLTPRWSPRPARSTWAVRASSPRQPPTKPRTTSLASTSSSSSASTAMAQPTMIPSPSTGTQDLDIEDRRRVGRGCRQEQHRPGASGEPEPLSVSRPLVAPMSAP